VLLEATADGHCALPLEKLKLSAVKVLEISEATVEQALSADADQRLPAAGTDRRGAPDFLASP
jgi:hypothetical protein